MCLHGCPPTLTYITALWDVTMIIYSTWLKFIIILWRHQMETFSALLAVCAGNSPVTGELSSQRPVTRSFDVLFDLSQNKRLSKQSRRRWFKTPLRSLWYHCNDTCLCHQVNYCYRVTNCFVSMPKLLARHRLVLFGYICKLYRQIDWWTGGCKSSPSQSILLLRTVRTVTIKQRHAC